MGAGDRERAERGSIQKEWPNARRKGLGVAHFSLQHNHVHLIVEVRDLKVLERWMKSLTVTMAKGMRKGKVQLKRYHLHVLRTIRETKNALHYVLFNDQRHGGKKVGEFSSVFTHPKVIEMIKSFCRNKSLTLFIERSQDFEELTNARSFLLLTSSV